MEKPKLWYQICWGGNRQIKHEIEIFDKIKNLAKTEKEEQGVISPCFLFSFSFHFCFATVHLKGSSQITSFGEDGLKFLIAQTFSTYITTSATHTQNYKLHQFLMKRKGKILPTLLICNFHNPSKIFKLV